MLRALLALGEGVDVVMVLRHGVDAPPKHARLRVARTDLSASPAALRFVGESLALRPIVREARADVVLHESFPVPALGKTPIVLTVHDLRALDPESRATSLGRRLLAPSVIRRGLERATRVVAVSKFTRDAVLRFAKLRPERVAVVLNAADHLEPPARPPSREPALVVAVGHLEARKGCDVL
ncbi:MAG TPA: glycosyltransferase, partial [Planctomycetota bacterium]|nr:glycosyltransferase [Planctomycetota bacterium]